MGTKIGGKKVRDQKRGFRFFYLFRERERERIINKYIYIYIYIFLHPMLQWVLYLRTHYSQLMNFFRNAYSDGAQFWLVVG